jgi:pimeloyl-ACP methyl ester carboxylesterase
MTSQSIRSTFLVVVIAGIMGTAQAAKVTGLKAFHREGQTFITWTELEDVQGEKYLVYQSTAKVTAGNLEKATLLATLPEGTCANTWELKHRKRGKSAPLESLSKTPGYGYRFCIVDNPDADPEKMLPEGTGLFVNTTGRDGSYYYAVMPEGQPDGMAALAEPVEEKVMLPGAVLAWRSKEGTSAIYTHWMDYSQWKPFREGYAYNFGVATPKGYDGKTPLPVEYYGHGMSGGYRTAPSAPYIKALWVWHGDKSGSWFFGMMNKDKTKVVNYVEQRVRWSFEWLKAARPNQFFRINPKLVNAHGHSMGGTMCTAFALRLGDIFSLTVSSSGATIHRRNKTWVGQASKLWGSVDENLPTLDGTGVWDHQDYAQWSLNNMAQETAFLLLSNGKKDGSVVFEPFPDFIDALQKSKRPFAASWNMRGYSWQGYSTKNGSWSTFKLRNDESLPALGNASNNDDPRTSNTGTVNGRLEWCSSGNNFDGGSKEDDLVDSADLWACNIRSLKGDATVDVTPRKCQAFKAIAGKQYTWENLDYSDPKSPKSIDNGVVVADKYGLVTVKQFKVGTKGWGNRLLIRTAN